MNNIITEGLKRRFVKDNSIPINIFVSPSFEKRLDLMETQFSARTKYEEFVKFYNENFSNESEYMTEHHRVADTVLEYLESNEALQRFKTCDFAELSKIDDAHKHLPKIDVYKDINVGKYFLSIDMIKANFTSMRHYDADIFNGSETYEDFISQFTDSEHIKNSKYIRQMIFGNVLPKRQQSYEKHLMDIVMTKIFNQTKICIHHVMSFSSDEIVFDITEFVNNDKVNEQVMNNVYAVIEEMNKDGVHLRADWFKLFKVVGTKGYMRRYITDNKADDFKCIDPIEYPFVIRKHENTALTETDYEFVYFGHLAKLCAPIEIDFSDNLQAKEE